MSHAWKKLIIREIKIVEKFSNVISYFKRLLTFYILLVITNPI